MTDTTCQGFVLVVPKGNERNNIFVFLTEALPSLAAASRRVAAKKFRGASSAHAATLRDSVVDLANENWYMFVGRDEVFFIYAPSKLSWLLTERAVDQWRGLPSVSEACVLPHPGSEPPALALPEPIRKRFLS